MKTTPLLRCLILGTLTAGLSVLPAQAQFQLLHAFGGSPNDGATPWWGASLVATGTTLYGVTANGGTSSNGVVFKVSTTGTGYQVLHHFNGYDLFLNPTGSKNDGSVAYGTPLLDAGVLYGMTALGGSNGFGTVWRMNTDGSAFQVLHHFGSSLDGYQPVGGLVKDGSTLYGLTSNGGSNSAIGVLFKIDTSGSGYQILRHFDVANSGLLTPYGTPLLAGGRLYGMTRLGGTGSQGGIWAVDADGSNYQVLHNFTGTSTDGSQPNGSLIIDGTTLYGMAQNGGANNAGIIFQIQSNGTGFQIMHNFALTEAHFPQGDLIRDGTTLYGFTKGGVTNIFSSNLGGGAIIRINTDGSNYKQLYTFLFPITDPDGQWPWGTPLKIGTKLFGITQLGGTLLGNNQGTVFAFDLTGNGGGGGGGGGGETDPIFDLAVVSLKAPKKVTLQDGKEPKPGKLSIAVQNTGNQTLTIPNLTALENLLNLLITSRGGCPTPELVLLSPTTFPVLLAPKKKLTVAGLLPIDCANDPLASSKTADHADYEYSVELNLTAIGATDANSANNTCPRGASGADKGCNKGLPARTDVIVK
ncbi:MAG: hypothetical protein PCFJNLEI_03190 [Verrucomicrobiae bacterium]|nr:hypothetical protein [Verrucomicrobiae bacterium]